MARNGQDRANPASRFFGMIPKSAVFIGLNLLCNTGVFCIVLAMRTARLQSFFHGHEYHFFKHVSQFPMFVTALHFACTSVSMRVMASYGLFELKQLPLAEVLPLAAAYALSVPLSNLSLAHNSVGMFQMARILGTPYLVALQLFYFKRKFSVGTLASCAVVVTGALMATVADLHVNAWGLFLAAACMVTTAQYQLLVEQKRKQLEASSVQLLAAVTPYAAGIALLVTPLVEPTGLFPPPLLAVTPHRDLTTEGSEGEVLHSGADLRQVARAEAAVREGEEQEGALAPAEIDAENVGGAGPTLMQFRFTSEVTSLLLLSALMAVGVNMSVFLLIGATDAVTSTVVGHLKTVAVLVGAFVLFGYPLSPLNLGGIAIAIAGMVAYTYYRRAAQAAAKLRLAARRKAKKGKKKKKQKKQPNAGSGSVEMHAGGASAVSLGDGSEVGTAGGASQRGGAASGNRAEDGIP